MTLAPVAVFVYNRLDNTQKTLELLAQNTLAQDTDVYVFSDGGRDIQSWQEVAEVRAYVRRLKTRNPFRSLTIVERSENIYLEANITQGIAQVFTTHDHIIVLEDDICTSPYFLEYMNQAFALYEDIPQVMHISGFTNLCLPLSQPFYFTPHMSGWGWGTWRQRWQTHFRHYVSREEALSGLSAQDLQNIQYGGVFPCLKSLDKQPIPWDICWEIAIYRAGGLCLTPGRTLVQNIGLNRGTHFRSSPLLQRYEYDREPWQQPIQLVRVEEPEKDADTEELFAQAIRDWGIRYTFLGRIIRFLYKKMVKKT